MTTNESSKISRFLVAGAIVVSLSACSPDAEVPDEEMIARVQTRPVPSKHEHGRTLYSMNCAPCHGAHGEGSENGPPMLHPLQARMHADWAFHRAVREGVQPHHYRFGAMPPIDEISDEDIDAVVAYVRWMQDVAGLRREDSSS